MRSGAGRIEGRDRNLAGQHQLQDRNEGFPRAALTPEGRYLTPIQDWATLGVILVSLGTGIAAMMQALFGMLGLLK